MKKRTYILIGIFVLGLLFGGVIIYIYMYTSQSPVSTEGISRLKMITRELSRKEVLYVNEHYDFSFYYPPELIFKEFDEGNGATTVVFQKPDDIKKGFQIYITPYEGDTITGDRILYDASGPVSNLQEENLTDNLLVATFISEAPILGETREIWWLHGGFLFELTTYAPLDKWIRDIVKTVEFEKN